MPGVAQRRTKLGGTWYDRGAVVPDEVITARTVAMGMVAVSESGDDRAEVERLKAELAAANAKLAEAGLLEDDSAGDRFDPAEHKVDEVLAHVDANPDDLDRVIDAELGGKARKTLLDDLERRQAETDDTGGDAGGE